MNKKSKGYVLAIVLTIIAISLGAYELEKSGVKLNIFNKNEEIIVQQAEEIKEENVNPNREIKLSKSDEEALKANPMGEKVKKNFNYPEKEKIHLKIYNAADNFKTCKGEFIEERAVDNSNMKCSFIVDTENKASITVDDAAGKKPVTLIYHNDKRKVFDDNDKIYREFEEIQPKRKSAISNSLDLFLHPDHARSDLGYLGISKFIISADSIAWGLHFYEDWNYTESTFLGRDAYKLEGVIDGALTKHNQGKFSLMMDKETGIILQFLSFDDNGGIKDKIECTKLELNTPIDESVYSKDTSGYAKK